MTSPITLHIAVFQDAPRPRDLDANLMRVRDAIAATEADLLVFPELFLSGYQTEGLSEVALAVTDPRVERLAHACHDAGRALLVGFVEPGEPGYYDSYLAIDRDGRVLPPVRKTHLFGGEREVFRAGSALTPIELCGVAIGVINCFEIEFPEVARTLALRGARLLVAGSANMHPYELDHRTAAVARAMENRLPLAYANRVGEESGHRFCGSSRIVDPDGGLLAELDAQQSATITATVDLSRRAGEATDMLAQRRPELYEC